MKKTFLLFAIFFALSAPHSLAQAVFKGGMDLFSGSGNDQVSKAYVMKGPYAIRWTLRDVKPTQSEDSLAKYWKPHTDKNPPWIAFSIMDVATREIVDHGMVTAWENQLHIKTGGKHYLIVSAPEHVAWTIYGKEGMLPTGGDGSQLKPLTAADTGGGTAEAAAAKEIEAISGKFQGGELESRIVGVKLIVSRSNSAADFAARWSAYSATQGW